MPLNTSTSEIVESALAGIIKAQKTYDRYSGYSWLYEAPEYFLTCEIARSIATKARGYVTLEEPIGKTLDRSKSLGPDKPPASINLRGRYDIVVWYAKDQPHGIIEVKNPVWMFSMIQKDIERVRDAVIMSKRNGGSIKFGAVAFFVGSKGPERKHTDVKEKFSDKESGWYANWKREAQKLVDSDELTVSIKTTRTFLLDDGGWAGGVLLVR